MTEEDKFINKTCPLLDRKCIKKECAAYTETEETWYNTDGIEKTLLEIKLPDSKKPHYYAILECILNKKNLTTRCICSQYDKYCNIEESEPINIRYTNHYEGGNPRLVYNGDYIEAPCGKTVITKLTPTPDKYGLSNWKTEEL